MVGERRMMMSTDKNLRPCPFCGCAAWLYGEGGAFASPDGSIGWRVQCQGKCHAVTCYWHTKAQAIEAWNTRDQDIANDEWLETVGFALNEKIKTLEAALTPLAKAWETALSMKSPLMSLGDTGALAARHLPVTAFQKAKIVLDPPQ
jgi:hypothetical protein